MDIWTATLADLKAKITSHNVNDVDDATKQRPLAIACLRTHPDHGIVRFLLNEGASIDFNVGSGLSFYAELERLAIRPESTTPERRAAFSLVQNIALMNQLKSELSGNAPAAVVKKV